MTSRPFPTSNFPTSRHPHHVTANKPHNGLSPPHPPRSAEHTSDGAGDADGRARIFHHPQPPGVASDADDAAAEAGHRERGAGPDEGHEGWQRGQEEMRALQGTIFPGQNFPQVDFHWWNDESGRCAPMTEMTRARLTERTQVVRRKGGKRHNGYLYIICKANPRHKQRQG